MTMHTPGPWTYDPRSGWINSDHCCQRGPIHVADIRGWGHLTGKGHGAHGLEHTEARAIQDANAKLIAAAPEAVTELERVTGLLETWATDHAGERTSEIDAALHCARAVIAKAKS